MKTLDVKPIIGSKARPWFDVFQLNLSRDVASKWFNREPHVDWVDGFGDADYWAIEFECGLKVSFEFIHHCNHGSVFATEPVSQHAGRHLNHWKEELAEYPPEMFERDRASMIDRFAPEMPELLMARSFQVWRQGDDGNQVAVGFPTSQLNAECWVTELESHKHKQTYWYTRVDDAQRGRTNA